MLFDTALYFVTCGMLQAYCLTEGMSATAAFATNQYAQFVQDATISYMPHYLEYASDGVVTNAEKNALLNEALSGTAANMILGTLDSVGVTIKTSDGKPQVVTSLADSVPGTSDKTVKTIEVEKATDDVVEVPKELGNSLLPGEGNIGTYSDLLKSGKRGDNITPHHMPSAEYMAKKGVSKNEGLCFNMEMPSLGAGGRHRKTMTYGRNMTDAEKAYYYSLSPRDALAFDINNLREIYQSDGLYSEIRPKLQRYIEEYKVLMPELFGK